MNPHSFALITGASSGIGECFARALAKRGENLILVARSAEKLRNVAQELAAANVIQAESIPFDLSVEGAGSILAAAVQERGLAIEMLINSAGFGARGEMCKSPLARQLDLIRLHINATVELTHHLVPPMVDRRRGAVINVSSMTSFQPMPFFATYAAAKAFMTSFSMGLAEELRPYGVAVVTLCPGGTRTNFVIEGDVKDRRKFPGRPHAPDDVVKDALRSLDRGGGLVVPGFVNKASLFAQRLVPRTLVTWATGRISRTEN